MRWRWRFQSWVTVLFLVLGVHSPGMVHDCAAVVVELASSIIIFLRASGSWRMPARFISDTIMKKVIPVVMQVSYNAPRFSR